MAEAEIVVPCYNEAQRLPVGSFVRYIEHSHDVSFLLVDDGSADGTLELLRRLEADHPRRVRVLPLRPNAGKAEAVRRGILFALEGRAELVGFWDADLATPLPAIDDFLEVFRAKPGVTMVLGSRVKLLGREIERHTSRHLLGRVFATFASLTLRLPVYDTQCGAKMFRRTEQLRGYFESPFLSRWIFDVEILARAMRTRELRADLTRHRRVYEYPLQEWRDIGGSKLRPSDFLHAAYHLLRIHRAYHPSRPRG